MTSRKWVYLFLTTLLIGGISNIFVGFAVMWDKYAPLFIAVDIVEILSVGIWLLGVGFIFSLISQAGFFAYLTVHRIGLGMFRSLWSPVQIVLIAFVLFDLVYFRYQSFANGEDGIFKYIIPAALLLIYGVIIAYRKMKETNKGAFIPALFFMVAVTIIEWVPALRADDQAWLLLMIFPLLICNTWQLLILHKLNDRRPQKSS
ncbi:KinB-signaling pathway activation protein [Calidifontibacillus oryziterrae]|uniref:KinB-signaling pathway activation protein n=1 Tax=Calidifontibacillus oryziterrae TaxID=1191699 RepID=UPI0002EF7FFE|nr:KinB-signaling pathway activation protein [Calidifontibacillus oryziterrae]